MLRMLAGWLLVASAPSLSSALSSSSAAPVQVWDNVLTSTAALHEAATISGLGHRVMDRSNKPRSLVECALDSIMREVKDETRFVEYWARQEWRHIEAHADVDELLARTDPKASFRYPQHGHVLYVQIGTHVQGPTCVFGKVSSGGELLSGEDKDDSKELFVVPAVTGRLLRFTGNALHSVPRPYNMWTLDFVQGAAEYKPEEKWGRSVILFNTWPDGPPLDVPLADGENCDTNEMECNPSSEWKLREIKDCEDETSARKRAKIWLLGDQKRRNHVYRTVNLGAPESIDDVLGEKSAVQRLMLYSHQR